MPTFRPYSKYRATKTPCSHGHIHDAKKEARRCDELHLLLKAHEISDLEFQKPFMLIPAQTEEISRTGKTGKPLKPKTHTIEQACTYVADFVYKDKSGNLVVEDCKGMRTTDYKIKRKLMLWVHGIKILET